MAINAFTTVTFNAGRVKVHQSNFAATTLCLVFEKYTLRPSHVANHAVTTPCLIFAAWPPLLLRPSVTPDGHRHKIRQGAIIRPRWRIERTVPIGREVGVTGGRVS